MGRGGVWLGGWDGGGLTVGAGSAQGPAVNTHALAVRGAFLGRERLVYVCALLVGLGRGVGLDTSGGELPRLVLDRDDRVVTQSCVVTIPPGTVIADGNTNGVLQIAADGITVEFEKGSVLRGAVAETPWDRLGGIGVRIEGRRGVTLVGARVHGFFNGLVATDADGLEVRGGDFSDNYRQRLRSTALAEDGADWLFPHHNDERRWRDEYGGAVCVERSRGVVIREVVVRRGQNGILLDRVVESRVFDNDCSFLSGWGLALWRSSGNVIARNAFDFCVRGHVEGVYNRGQDSAGILCFEQSNDNVFAENSATHGGDGFFGFAGHEALGERWVEEEKARLRSQTGGSDVAVEGSVRVPAEVAKDFSARGCNRNLLVGNDFSYAPAHGIEMTFSEGNVFARNRLVENAICGIWGGYSSDTLIAENLFEGNGGMAYGLERGGVNMEHASGNRILRNTFRNNKCGIHLWWDNDAGLLRSPGVAGNYRGVSGNIIAGNRVVMDERHPFRGLRDGEILPFLQLRDDGTNHLRDNLYLRGPTRMTITNAVELAVGSGCEPLREGVVPKYRIEVPRLPGKRRPVGARAELRGRDRIIVDEWGPWDHASPLFRALPSSGSGEAVYEVLGVARAPKVRIGAGAGEVGIEVTASAGRAKAWRLAFRAASGVVPFAAEVEGEGLRKRVEGTLIAARWDCVFFPWSVTTDPRTNLVGWRELAAGPGAVRLTTGALDFPFGMGGPRDLRLSEELSQRGPGRERFGLIASTRLRLPKGEWLFRTLSDDGVRVTVDGRPVLENWTWHGPTPNEARYRQLVDAEVEIGVEHFEIDGYATLKLSLEPVAEGR